MATAERWRGGGRRTGDAETALRRARRRAVAFQYLTSGDSMAEVGRRFGVGGSRVGMIVIQAIYHDQERLNSASCTTLSAADSPA